MMVGYSSAEFGTDPSKRSSSDLQKFCETELARTIGNHPSSGGIIIVDDDDR